MQSRVTKPPPFPISPIPRKLFSVLHIGTVYQRMSLSQVRIYLFLQPSNLAFYDLFQFFLHFRIQLLAFQKMIVHFCNREIFFTIRALSLKTGSFISQISLRSQIFEYFLTIGQAFFPYRFLHLISNVCKAEDMLDFLLTISTIRVYHKLQADTAYKPIMIFLLTNRSRWTYRLLLVFINKKYANE